MNGNGQKKDVEDAWDRVKRMMLHCTTMWGYADGKYKNMLGGMMKWNMIMDKKNGAINKDKKKTLCNLCRKEKQLWRT